MAAIASGIESESGRGLDRRIEGVEDALVRIGHLHSNPDDPKSLSRSEESCRAVTCPHFSRHLHHERRFSLGGDWVVATWLQLGSASH